MRGLPVSQERQQSIIDWIKSDPRYSIDPESGVVLGPTGRIGQRNNGRYGQVKVACGESIYTHRLIWIWVHGPIPPNLEINHISGVKTDNRISNLELVTSRENTAHAYRIGLRHVGERAPGAKLSDEQVIECRRRYADGEIKAALAKRFGVTNACICLIISRENWRHLLADSSVSQRVAS